MAYVYQHKRLDTDQVFYVGIGDGEDYKRAYSTKGRNKWWKNIVSKHNYKVEILKDNLNWEQACDIEKYYIKKYGRLVDGGILVNITEGGDGFKSNHTNETKVKISNTLSNKTYEEIHGYKNANIEREKRRIAAINQWKSIDKNAKNEQIEKMKLSLKKYYEEHPEAKIQKVHKCPHCSKEGSGNAMYQWHFDNCKNKKIDH
jgi:hypothetical protein